jgi:DNA polymerase III subunit epsilon
MRDIAFIDLETTGLDPERHEIIEVAVIRVNARDLHPIDEVECRVRPTRIGEADPAALELVGYSSQAWADAPSLVEAMTRIAPLLEGAILAGHNVAFDKGFLESAWRTAGSRPGGMDYHLLDTATLAWPLWSAGAIDRLSLDEVCECLGLSRQTAHRAMADARCSLEVARRLLPSRADGVLLAALEGDERAILRTLLGRMHAGREDYGPWRTDDDRSYPREALLEVLDALNYCAAELVRIGRGEPTTTVRTRRIYVCHPFADNPEGNSQRVGEICRALTESGFVPIAPQLYLPRFIDEATERDSALRLCIDLLDCSDELRVYGGRITKGMRGEIEHAESRGIPVRFAQEAA